MTMLEKMARAIDPAAWVADKHFYNHSRSRRRLNSIDAARSVLAALREPTEGMLHDGALAIDHPSVHMGGPSDHKKRLAAQVWRAMLAAAEGGE